MGRPISISLPHDLGVTEARRRIDEGFGRLTAQLGSGGLAGLQRRWEADTMSFAAQVMGQQVSGRLEVLAREVRMEIDLPGLFGFIAGKIKGRLKSEGRLLLAKQPPSKS